MVGPLLRMSVASADSHFAAFTKIRVKHTATSMATRLWVGRPRNRSLFPGRDHKVLNTNQGPSQGLIPMCAGDCFPGGDAAGA